MLVIKRFRERKKVLERERDLKNLGYEVLKTIWNSAIFIARTGKRLLWAVSAVPDISGVRPAYQGAVPSRLCGGEGRDKELVIVREFSGELYGKGGVVISRPSRGGHDDVKKGEEIRKERMRRNKEDEEVI
ncbi:hypothetical protein Tco_0422632 [Tanacetum coccineum]